MQGLRREALRASLGCGNPTALARLAPGETVLDLGSGGGIDVLLSTRRVGPTGKVYGLDMTGEMLALAIPLPDASVDVLISNCVINLSADKRAVLAEAFRVLRPGGRFAVSDVVVRGAVFPDAVRRSTELWTDCVAGELQEQEFLTLLRDAAFEDSSIEPTRIFDPAAAASPLALAGLDAVRACARDGSFASAFVRATKPRRDHPASAPGEDARSGGTAPASAASAASAAKCRGPECCDGPSPSRDVAYEGAR